MVQTELALQYQRLVRRRFPSCIVADVGAGPEDTTVLDVFFVPDNNMADFDLYLYDRIRPDAEAEGIDWALLIPHSVANTVSRYPDAVGLVKNSKSAISAAG